MEIVELKLDELTPFEHNAKIHTDKDVDVIANSIKEFGMNDPVGIWGDKNIIVEGHGRLLALKKLGYEKVPCIRLDHLTDEQRRMYTLTHNKSAELSEWDFEKLEQEMKQLEFELSNFGFDEKELQIEFDKNKETEEDDFDIEENIPEEATCKKGQLWKLGNHYLMCGDSTNKEDVEKLMQGNKADMVFTDPPYGVSMSRSVVSGKDNSIMNDNLSDKEFIDLLEKAIKNIVAFSKNNSPLYLWIGFRAYSKAEEVVKKYYKINNCIVWEKPSIGLGGRGYRYQHELCIFSGNINDRSLSDVWKFGRDNQGLHPTMKPIDLVSYALKNSSEKNNLILDLFGGSGSTLIACEQLNRICYTMELDEKYCDVIIKRWETLTGLKAELL